MGGRKAREGWYYLAPLRVWSALTWGHMKLCLITCTKHAAATVAMPNQVEPVMTPDPFPSLLSPQTCAYELMRTPEREELAVERGLWHVWNKQIVIGIIPPRHEVGSWQGRMRGHACPCAHGCL